MKRYFFTFLILVMMWQSVPAQNPIIRDASRVYDIVTDADSCYLFSEPKPCFDGVYYWAATPMNRLLQEYVLE